MAAVNFHLQGGILSIAVAADLFTGQGGYPYSRGFINDVQSFVLSAHPNGVIAVGHQAAGKLAGVFLSGPENGKFLAFRCKAADNL